MAKQSSVNKNNRRKKLVARYAVKRKALKAAAADLTKPAEVRFAARLKLAQLPRNSSATRVRNRCELTGRARAYYRKLRVCRNMLRQPASQGLIPGMVKSSWQGGTGRDERSARGYAHPHPQRAAQATPQSVVPGIQRA